ncbi:MAG: hypothetical protein H0W72_13205 [Planctomycetes bacterium]|nr:hypothetical protein [Planctomycetota bacterium]
MPRALILLLVMVSLIPGSERSEAVRIWLVDTYPEGAAPAVTAQIAGTTYANSTLVAARPDSVQLSGSNLDVALPWALLGDAGICQLAETLLESAPATVRESWLMLATACGRAESPAFRRIRDDLVRLDPAAAARLAPAKSGPERPNADPDADPDADPEVDPEVNPDEEDVDSTEPDKAVASMIDAQGKVIRSAYLRSAYDYSASAIGKRLGPTAKQLGGTSGSPKAKIWEPPIQIFKAGHQGAGQRWNIGGPPTNDGGDYSSTHGQILYAPDAGNDPGVDRVSILEQSHNTFTYEPTPTWWGGSHPEPMLATKSWKDACPKGLGSPVAIARGSGVWCNSGIIAFTSGLLGTAGTCTSGNPGTFLKLPPGKVPSAIALTPHNEFALVTVWDVTSLKGELAVIALDCSAPTLGAHSWAKPNPCLPNVGSFTSMKLMGFIELPFATPTGIAATGNRSGSPLWLKLAGKNAAPKEIDFAKQEIRDSFASRTGENAKFLSNSGYAVVISRFENKAAFIDLQPLFQHVGMMYCTTDKRYKETRGYGPDPKQWPCDFSVDDQPKPVVVKCLRVKAPTAVNVTIGGDHEARAHIATESGILQIWQVGGLATDAPATSAGIAKIGTVTIGRNPTCLAYVKDLGWGQPASLNKQLIAVCRGDREVVWIEFTGQDGKVIRRLQDVRLTDPVHAEIADAHGTESGILTVTDFAGRQIVNYRFGPVVFHTNGKKRFDMGPDGKAEFECGGSMSFPGCPYMVSGTNVN